MADVATAIPALRRALAPGAEEKALARLAKDPQINRQLDQFAKAVAKATDLKAALRDPRVLNVLLPALGLPDAVGQAGLAVRALTEDPADPNGLLAKLPDKRWKDAAQTLNLKERGLEALRDPKMQAVLADGLRRLSWQKELDADHPGISDAMLFEQRAASVKSAYELLSDPVLRRVITGALGLPQEIAIQPVETQARAITSRLDLSKLQNPREVAKLAERYVVAAAGTGTGGPVSPLLALLA
ncbi:MAG: DUF1217 domain-containing protein [Acetobacteraceae bacterium]|nr:DUF1217 domain-containing protein [Acetobacteraceae bacterium]MDI3308666.1 DUF1217 domain-containing protein [Acetobacteraceae bacterium]